jgi:hypothetical protein
MQIKVTKLTDETLMRRANSSTMRFERDSKQSLTSAYAGEHSTIRTQLFWIEMVDIPTFVSVHLVRHKIGVEHFVGSNREDLGGNSEADRHTPVTHCMLINAAALLELGRARLCKKASKQTQEVVQGIRLELLEVDPALSKAMVPRCVYRNGICGEAMPCGAMEHTLRCYPIILPYRRPSGSGFKQVLNRLKTKKG